MNTGWRSRLNRLRRRIARVLLFRMLFGERSMGRLLPNTRISAASCIEHEDRLALGDHVYIGPFNFIEASGGITETNLVQYASSGVDIVSMGALTNNAKALDISLEITKTNKKKA